MSQVISSVRSSLSAAVDVGGAEALGARAHREPGAARVLALDREQALDDSLGSPERPPRQALRVETRGEAQPASSRSTTKTRVSFGGIAGGLPSLP